MLAVLPQIEEQNQILRGCKNKEKEAFFLTKQILHEFLCTLYFNTATLAQDGG